MTRAADNASISGTAWGYNVNAGTMVAKIARLSGAGGSVGRIADGANVGGRYILSYGYVGPIYWDLAGTGAQASYSAGVTGAASYKIAGSYSAAGTQIAVNGALGTPTSVLATHPWTSLFIGQSASNGQQINGFLQSLTYRPKALSPTQLQALSTLP